MDKELQRQLVEERKRILEMKGVDAGVISQAVIGYALAIKELPEKYSSEKVRAEQAEKRRQRFEEERLIRRYLPPAVRGSEGLMNLPVMFSQFIIEFEGNRGVQSFPLWYEKGRHWNFTGGSKPYSQFQDNCSRELLFYLPFKSEAGFIKSGATLHSAGFIADGVSVDINNLLPTENPEKKIYIIYPPSEEKIVVNVKERTDSEFRCYEGPPRVFRNGFSVIGERTIRANDFSMRFRDIVIRVLYSNKYWDDMGTTNDYLEEVWGKSGLSRRWGSCQGKSR